MKPPPFTYLAPGSVEEVLAHLEQYGDEAVLLAGGQSLVPMMNFRLAHPGVVIDLNRVEGLAYVRPSEEGGLRLGAMTRQRAVERSKVVAGAAPLLHEAVPWIAHPQIRNRGTLGGSIAHADPAAELPAVMVALEAEFRLRSVDGDRRVPAEAFFVDLLTTDREPEELLVEIAVPKPPPRSRFAFREIARRHGDYALVGVAAHVVLDERGGVERARIVLLNVDTVPRVAESAGALLEGELLTDDVIRAVAEAAAGPDIDPSGDIHASAAYRRRLARVLTERAMEECRGSGV